MTVENKRRPNETELPSKYDPLKVEGDWYRYWLEQDYFRAEVDPERDPYCIVIPPPNVTGKLHIGHALNNTLQDILIRWRRMQGYATLWQPGTDHAGIATQAVVERELAKEGKSRHELGREKFLEKVWEWKETYEANIIRQLQKLGASCDWSRTRFTMDEGLSRAVEEVFIRYYEKGLIYRGDYIVNWCPRCYTAISDLEVEHEERDGNLWHIRYPLLEGDGYIEVATTRPETMLGDTAVAVNPEDERYRHLVGRKVRLPLMNREIPIVADSFVDMEFGTGAVKVTPFHDPNDFEMGARHGLPGIQVIGNDGVMTKEAGKYAGVTREEARKAVVRDLEAEGLLVKVDAHTHAVGRCQRCETVVEPLVSRQWFVRMKPLAEPALRVVREGKVEFVPERFTRIYEHWLENIRDWCISRQLWWGHRIPAWECKNCGETIVAREAEAPEVCPKCGSTELERDPDVLDTWFSSALWPFSTLGWPDDTEELRFFFPTSTLVTGFDIIFFWVARMIFSSLEFMGEVPFRHVLIHGLIRDSEGRKMSKSLGNVLDPLEVIDRYGADALRFTLITGNTPGNDQRWHQEKLESSRNFGNKIWNAARFALMNLGDFRVETDEAGNPVLPDSAGLAGRDLADRWIESRLHGVTAEVTRLLENFELGEAARKLYDFIWGELCDWYIELVKPRLYGHRGEESRRAAQATLWRTFEETMRLLHPFMPFLSEEVWQRLVPDARRSSVMIQPWPEGGERDLAAEREMELIMEVIRAIRNLRSEMHVPPAKKARVSVAGPEDARRPLEGGRDYILTLAGVETLELLAETPKAAQAVTAAVGPVEVVLPLEGLVDVAAEKARLEKELTATRAELEKARRKLGNPSFVEKAPAEVVEKEREREAEYAAQEAVLAERLRQLG